MRRSSEQSVWISGLNKGGAADVEKSLYLTDRLDDNAVRLAALKLVLYFNESMIRAIESVCQHCCDIKYRDRILREKRVGVSYVKL